MTIERFIGNLKSVADTDIIENQYRNPIPADNLFVYLNYMTEISPETLFVGEAPGYLGCALTGVPFTDEYRLTAKGNIGCLPLLRAGYSIAKQNQANPHKEMSATVMWSSFVSNSFFPMLWNIFPFHPHELNNRNSNRTPTQKEIQAYIYVLNDLLTLLPTVKRIYAVGRKAEDMMNRLHMTIDYIRHPARGGATECKEAISIIARSA